AFARVHAEGEHAYERTFLEGPGFTVEALLMDHGTPSVAYVVREAPHVNIDTEKSPASGCGPDRGSSASGGRPPPTPTPWTSAVRSGGWPSSKPPCWWSPPETGWRP